MYSIGMRQKQPPSHKENKVKSPNVALSVRIIPEVALVLTQEAEDRNVRSTNVLVAQILTDWVKTRQREKLSRMEALRF